MSVRKTKNKVMLSVLSGIDLYLCCPKVFETPSRFISVSLPLLKTGLSNKEVSEENGCLDCV